MDGMSRGLFIYYWKRNYYVLINCIKHCVRGEFIQNYFKIFSFFLIWDKNLGSHTGWPVAKPLWIRRCYPINSLFRCQYVFIRFFWWSAFPLKYQNAYGYQTFQCGDMQRGALTHKYAWHFNRVVMLSLHISICRCIDTTIGKVLT